MGDYTRFDMFIDCLWALTILFAWHLLPFSFFRSEGLMLRGITPAMVFHATVLATFVYLFGLRLRRNPLLSRQRGSSGGSTRGGS